VLDRVDERDLVTTFLELPLHEPRASDPLAPFARRAVDHDELHGRFLRVMTIAGF
jgi:hypothetical protein